MKIRITGLPEETTQAVKAITANRELDVIEVSEPRPNRGDSRMVRVYIEARLLQDTAR
jgi:hypothetical protein